MIVDGRPYWFALVPNDARPCKDAFGAGDLIIPQGSRMELKFAAFFDPETLRDITNVESAKLVIRKDNAAGALLATKTITSDAMNAALTIEEWRARDGQHFTITLEAEETKWPIVAKWRGKIWWELAITTTGGQQLARWGYGICQPSGISTAGESGVTGDTYFNSTQSDARFAPIALVGDVAAVESELETKADASATEVSLAQKQNKADDVPASKVALASLKPEVTAIMAGGQTFPLADRLGEIDALDDNLADPTTNEDKWYDVALGINGTMTGSNPPTSDVSEFAKVWSDGTNWQVRPDVNIARITNVEALTETTQQTLDETRDDLQSMAIVQVAAEREVLPLALDPTGKPAMGVKRSTGKVVAALDPDDEGNQAPARRVASEQGFYLFEPLEDSTRFPLGPIDPTGKPTLYLDLSTGEVVGNFRGMGGKFSSPLARFGFVTDVHQADKDSTSENFYRDSAAKMTMIAEHLNSLEIDFVIQNGDFVDSPLNVEGYTPEQTIEDLETITAAFDLCAAPRFHVFGNHDVQIIDKPTWMGITGMQASYYSFTLHQSLHVVVLDSCRKSDGTDWAPGNYNYQQPYIDAAQRAWLEADLAAHSELPTIVFCHYRLDSSGNYHIVNASAVRNIFEAAGNVRAVFAGHQHVNGYYMVNGIQYHVMQATIRNPYPDAAYSVVEVWPHGISIQGYGLQESRDEITPRKLTISLPS